MEKEALLDIILQDLKELDKLLRTFSGKDHIPEAFIHLAQSKVSGIANEVDLLGSLAKSSSQTTAAPETTPQPESEPTPITAPAPEPQEEPKMEQKEELKEEAQEQSKVEPKEQSKVESKEQPKVQTKEQSTLQRPAVAPPSSPETPGAEKKVLGELLGKDRTSFNEKLGNGQSKAGKKVLSPVRDLRKALGINDRFFYQRELFNGSADLMYQTLDQLNQMDNLSSAKSFISANFSWQSDQEAVHAFMDLLERRFHQ
ncbi:hypothetical protein [Geofilum rhodophaeum]|uniref:hypothetical protein n=1 Tax=Geofilum rhodophaeum TaxID=1965019 RepID=UPI000B520AD0|nr:hypothetical protein [Geofilum rhodophaeum]